MRFYSLLPARRHTCDLASQSRLSPWLGESSLVEEALVDTRRHHEERLHNNRPERMRGTRGVQQEATE